MMKLWYRLVFYSVFLFGCREPFGVELDQSDKSVLVVEGFIEISGKESVINLSRSSSLDQVNGVFPEKNAMVTLENEDFETWQLFEGIDGEYTFNEQLDENNKYRLRIKTVTGEEYISEYINPLISPEIDDLSFIRDEQGLSIVVTTQGDDLNSYFIWNFHESYIFRPSIISNYVYDKEFDNILLRNSEQMTNTCWMENPSTNIVLEYSRRFSDNKIFQKELLKIPNFSEKLGVRYSISVRQRVVDRNAYLFWEILKKNSDDLSGIFSPMPSLLNSNVSNIVDPSQNVIGFISIGSSSEKRIYISNEEVKPWIISVPDYFGCTYNPDTIPPNQYSDFFSVGNFVPVELIMDGMTELGSTGAPIRCVDCTLRGNKQKPDYWED